MIEVICVVCKKVFIKSQEQHDRTIDEHDSNHCCSNSCSATLVKNRQKHNEYSPFVRHKKQAKRRAKLKGRDFDLTLHDLKTQWDSQEGICPYTGWEMDNRSHEKEKIELTLQRASLDRKDSNRGYLPDNIQFVSFAAQNAKHNFTEQDFFILIESIAKYKDLLNGQID